MLSASELHFTGLAVVVSCSVFEASCVSVCPPQHSLFVFNTLLSAPFSFPCTLCACSIPFSRPPCPLLSPSSAGRLNNFYSFDPVTMTWRLLSTENSSDIPSPRECHGLAQDGARLYVHGGAGKEGNAHAPFEGDLCVCACWTS